MARYTNINLYREKKDCSACAACLNSCPKEAIYMQEDKAGFLYPYIDREKCIQCGQCLSVCNYQNGDIKRSTKKAYAGMAIDDTILRTSSSGGFFAVIATEVLKKGGIVYGCAFELHEDGLHPEHIRIDNINSLSKLQGSKYVQSKIGTIYQDVSKDLMRNKLVLFSGTPCQVDALYGFLKMKQYRNLLTIDIVCHGVPSERMFTDYIHMFEKKLKGKIIGFSFRDKTDGWGLKGLVEYIDKNGNCKKRIVPICLSSYYHLFLKSEIYRENCYTCKYAGHKRVGDITIGDFWGIEIEHPELLIENNGILETKKGVSCILINSQQGELALRTICNELLIKESSLKKVTRQNRQLNTPSVCTDIRKYIFHLYESGGYECVDKWYYQSIGWKQYAYRLKYSFIQLYKNIF